MKLALALVGLTLVGAPVARIEAPMALWHMPTAWGYALSPGCQWSPKPWTRALGPDTPPAKPDRAGRRAEWQCWKDRGAKSLVIFHLQVLPRWPSPASFARWENEDRETQDPPLADWAVPDPALPR